MKICSRCNQKKPLEMFSSHKWGDGRRPDCKACRSAYSRDRARRLGKTEMTARKHRITGDIYREVLAIQGNRCPLCGDPPDPNARALAVDHDHATDRLRGILCARCNGGLGMFRDNPATLRRAAEYLEFWRDGWRMFEENGWPATNGLVDPA